MIANEPFWYNDEVKIVTFLMDSLNGQEREFLLKGDNFEEFENNMLFHHRQHANDTIHPLPLFTPPPLGEERYLNLVVLKLWHAHGEFVVGCP